YGLAPFHDRGVVLVHIQGIDAHQTVKDALLVLRRVRRQGRPAGRSDLRNVTDLAGKAPAERLACPKVGAGGRSVIMGTRRREAAYQRARREKPTGGAHNWRVAHSSGPIQPKRPIPGTRQGGTAGDLRSSKPVRIDSASGMRRDRD